VELRTALTTPAAKDITSQAFAVDADQNRIVLDRHDALMIEADASHRKGKVRLRINHGRVGDEIELAKLRRQLDDLLPSNQSFALPSITDQVLDGVHSQAVLLAEFTQLGHTRHVAVRAAHFADDGRLLQSRETCQIDASLGVARPNEDSPFSSFEAGDVALSANQVVGSAARIDGDLDRARSIEGRRTGCYACSSIDVRRKWRGRGVDVVARQGFQMKPLTDARAHREANQATSVSHHEVDGFGRDFLGRNDQITLILSMLVVHQDDHPPRLEISDGFLDGREPLSGGHAKSAPR